MLLACVQADAQPSVAQAPSVSGTVIDQTGAVLPNAKVELRSAAGTPQVTVTDASGHFRFSPVAAGRYDVRATFEGFEPVTVRVTIGGRSSVPGPSGLRITLPLAVFKQEVHVGEETTELKAAAVANLDSSTVDQKTLENLPVFNQDVLATMSRFLDASAIGTNGATLVVNGIEVNALNVSASAIQQVKINQDPYASEFPRPGRGRIEVVTKPGSQEFSGTANVVFRDSALDARNAFAVVRPPERRRIVDGFLGGPVRRFRDTAFTVSLKHDAEDTQSIVVAQDPSGLVQANVANPYRDILAAGTLTHQKGNHTTIALTASYQDETRHNQGVGGVTLPSVGVNWHSVEQDSIYNQQSILTPKLLNQFRVLVGNESETWTSLSAAPLLVVLDAFNGGGAQSDRLRTEHHFTLADIVTWSSGRHVLKGGFQIPDWSRRRFDDDTNTGGTFYFSSLADYSAGRPLSFIQQAGDGHVVFLEKVLGGFVQDEIRVRPNLSVALGLRYDWQVFFHDNNNIAPRASFAFAPAKDGGTVVRGGAGVFYDRTGPGPIQDLLKYDGHRLIRYVLTNPGYPDASPAAQPLSARPPGIVSMAPDVSIPFSLQYSLSLERRLRKGTVASVTYSGSRGFDQFRSRDVNAPLPPLFLTRPDPTLGVVREIESAGRSVGHSLQLTLKGQVTRWFAGSAQYVLSQTMNDTSGVNWMAPNNYDLSREYARADSDQRHRVDVLGTINRASVFNLGVALALYSGRPYSITTGRDDFGTGIPNARPAGASRNDLQGPGYADLDLRWSRDVSKGGSSSKATIAVDAFNVLNHVNYARYVGTVTSPFFGRAIAAQPARRVQVSLRLKFGA